MSFTIYGFLEAFDSIELFEQARRSISILREIDKDDNEIVDRQFPLSRIMQCSVNLSASSDVIF